MSGAADEIPAVLAALRPYLPDIVLIGGWVPELYRRYGGLSWEGRLSRTMVLHFECEKLSAKRVSALRM